MVAEPDRLRVASPGYFAQEGYEPDGTFELRPGAARFEPNWWPTSSLAGLLAALEIRPSWAYEQAAATAERCRELLSPHVEVIVPADRSTLVAFRPAEEPAALVERLLAAGVYIRELPRIGLARVSCGWWTSEDDLQRLVATLTG